MAHDARFTDIDLEREERRREHLRSSLPAAAAVVMLLGVVLVGALALQRMLDLGVWLVTSGG